MILVSMVIEGMKTSPLRITRICSQVRVTLGMRWKSNDRLVAGERKAILANIQKEARRNRERRKGLR